MVTLVLGVAALLVLLWLAKIFTKVDVQRIASFFRLSSTLKTVGGMGALALGTVLQARGAVLPGTLLYLIGAALLGWLGFGPAGFGRRTQKSPGQVSRVRSAYLEMELDHDSGAMRGVILAGPREGTALEALDVSTILSLFNEIDEESRALLAAYLDRRDPAWREHAQADAAAGRGSPSRGPMTHEEAYQILGLEAGASPEDITRAHRTLMKKFHPDQGGTNYLAARINEAKDTLLRQHR